MNEKKNKKEGRRIRALDPMHYVGPYLMTSRVGSTNYFPGKVEVSVAEEYIKQKKEQGLKDFSMMHLFLAAFVRVYSQHPEMNRFIRGRRIYARNNIEFLITIKKEMKLNAADTVVKVCFEPTATAEDVYHVLNKVIEEAKNESGDFDKTVGTLCKFPRFIMRGFAGILNVLDFYGLIPKSLVDVSPFHGTLVITSLASLGIPPVYHHLYEFGNIPAFFAFGRKYVEYEVQSDGSVKKCRYMDYRITCDERIADGHAYSVALRYMNSLIRKPVLLDNPPEKVVEDIP